MIPSKNTAFGQETMISFSLALGGHHLTAVAEITLETLSKHLRQLGGGGDGRAGSGLRPPPLGAKLEY